MLDVLTLEDAIWRIVCWRRVINGAFRLIRSMLGLWHVALVIIEESVHGGCVRVVPRRGVTQ